MQEEVKFEKVYTRDTCVILQQAWLEAFARGLEKRLNVTNPYKPQIIYYLNDGVLEIWENKKAKKWLENELLKRNQNDSQFSISIFEDYRKRLIDFEDYWTAGGVEKTDELIKFTYRLFEAMTDYIVMYYSSNNEKTPISIKKIADEIRKQDKFFDENDKFIRNSLKTIYPDLRNYVVAISKDEIKNPPSLEELKERSLGAILILDGIKIGSLKNYSRDNPSLFFKDLEFVDNDGELKGNAAFRGFVTGKVIIVKRKDQVDLVKEGEIIVSPMTTPDYVPAMKIAAAFVTDEGGVLSHAAIIARELKKPCIIGTKIATKVLHDGDLVEVDANKGIVKILKRAN